MRSTLRRAWVIPTVAMVGLVVAWAAPAAAQQAQISVEPAQRSIQLDDELRIVVKADGAFVEIVEPSLDGWELVSRDEPVRFESRYGSNVRIQVQRVYGLVAKRSGTLTFGPVKLRGADGKIVAESQVVTIQVAEPPKRKPLSPQEARRLEDKARQNAFLHVESPRTIYYVGEPVVLTWQLFVDERIRLGRNATADVSRAPVMDGMLVEDLRKLESSPTVQKRRVAGRLMQVVPVIQYLATPLKAGHVVVKDAAVNFSKGGFNPRSYTLRSDPLRLRVQDVPHAGRPAWFRDGNIGRFQMSADVKDRDAKRPTHVKTGDRVVLDVAITGEGNLVSVKAPVLEGGDAFEIQPLPTAADDVIEKDERGMHGRRNFQFLLTPLEAGDLTTPTVRFSYFDTAAGSYKTLTVPGRKFTATGARISKAGREAAFARRDVTPIFEAAPLERRSSPFFGSVWFWLLVVLPVGGFGYVEFRHRRGVSDARNPERRRSKEAGVNARKRLKAAERAQRDKLVKDFFGQIARTFSSYFEERVNLPATGMTHEELRQGAVEAGYPTELVEAVVVELENCDFARFAPAASVEQQMRDALARAQELITKLEQASPKRKP